MSGLLLFTIIHVAISLVGIVSGVPFAYGLLTSRKLNRWSTIFLASTTLTSITGFGFPADRITPAHVLGVLSLLLLAMAVYARYSRSLQGRWWIAFVVSSLVAFYLNAFVLVVQLFLKVPVLRVTAPTQTEATFVVAQLTLLIGFVLLTVLSLRHSRPAM